MNHPKHSDLKFHALGGRWRPETTRIVKKYMGILANMNATAADWHPLSAPHGPDYPIDGSNTLPGSQ